MKIFRKSGGREIRRRNIVNEKGEIYVHDDITDKKMGRRNYTLENNLEGQECGPVRDKE